MNWRKKNWLSLIAIVVSVVAIFMSLRNDPFTVSFDSAVLVGVATILSVPTAILIAWQIYQVFNMEKMVNEKINKYEDNINDKLICQEYETTRVFVIFACRNSDYDLAMKLSTFIPEYIIRGKKENNIKLIEHIADLLNMLLDAAERDNFTFSPKVLKDFQDTYSPLSYLTLIENVLARIRSETIL